MQGYPWTLQMPLRSTGSPFRLLSSPHQRRRFQRGTGRPPAPRPKGKDPVCREFADLRCLSFLRGSVRLILSFLDTTTCRDHLTEIAPGRGISTPIYCGSSHFFHPHLSYSRMVGLVGGAGSGSPTGSGRSRIPGSGSGRGDAPRFGLTGRVTTGGGFGGGKRVALDCRSIRK